MSETTQSFGVFVYPFRHNLPALSYGRARQEVLARLLRERWEPWLARLLNPNTPPCEEALPQRLIVAFDASYYFLGAVREMLFPEFCAFDRKREAGEQVTVHNVKRWCDSATEPSAIACQQTIHLTLKSECLAPWRPARLVYSGHGGQFESTFSIEWIDLYLFPDGIGLLALKVCPKLPLPTTHQCLAKFNHYFRTVLPLQPDWNVAKLVPGDGGEITAQQWIDELILGTHAFGSHYTKSKQAMEQGERFYTFSYYCGSGVIGLPEALKGDDRFQPGEVAAYEIVSTIPLEAPNLREPGHIRRMLDRHGLAIWADWSAVALRDGVAFVSHAGQSGQLGRNVEHDYLYLYLYCLQQKTALLDLQDSILMMEPGGWRVLRSLERLFDRFIQFRNRFWFVEVTRRPLGVELYRTMQAGLDTREMYGAVGTEIEDLHEYYQGRLGRRINNVVNLLAFVGFPLSLSIGFLGINLRGITANEGLSIVNALALCGVGLAVGGGAWWVARRWRR